MKKIAVNTVKAFMKERKRADTYIKKWTIGDSTFEVAFRTALTVGEKSVFINRVISGCFDSSGKYRPEYVTPMLRATIIQMCTNIPPLTLKNTTDEDEIPALDLDGMNELYLALRMDDISDSRYQVILEEMTYLCNQAIEWRKGNLVAGISEVLSAISKKIDSTDTAQLIEYAKDISKATKGMKEGELANKVIDLAVMRDKTDV